MRRLAFILALMAAPDAADAAWPDWAERWLFNARERTAEAAEALEDDATTEAAAALDSAMRLERGAHQLYNAGTGRLRDGRPDAALPLAEAAESAPPGLAASAYYNLGNARREAGDLEGAISAFEGALRADPGHEPAKINLELALRQLQEQQQDEQDQQQQQDPQEQDQQQEEEQEQQQEEGGDEQEEGDQGEEGEPQEGEEGEDEPREEGGDQEEGREPPPEGSEGPPPAGQQGSSEGNPLPQFQDLPDMTAEEAAAILEAVENLEREQRRREALEAARANAPGKKDW